MLLVCEKREREKKILKKSNWKNKEFISEGE
jgi:hypothetical protein